jgi:hypothetical protein
MQGSNAQPREGGAKSPAGGMKQKTANAKFAKGPVVHSLALTYGGW